LWTTSCNLGDLCEWYCTTAGESHRSP
jgi:hypothetical protein